MSCLSQIYSIPDVICDIIESESSTVTLSMGESLSADSDSNNNIYFLISGRLRQTAPYRLKTINLLSPFLSILHHL